MIIFYPNKNFDSIPKGKVIKVSLLKIILYNKELFLFFTIKNKLKKINLHLNKLE